MQLTMENWGPFAHAEIDFRTPLTLVVGANGSGKSFVRDAIAFALTGLCRGVRTKKALPSVVIRDGARSASVVLSMDDGTNIVRSITPAGSTLEIAGADGVVWAGTEGEVQQRLYRVLGLDPTRADAALESWALLDMDETDRRKLLARALGIEATHDAIHEVLVALGLGESPEAARIAEIAVADGFRPAQAAATEERHRRKRALEELVRSEPGPVRSTWDLVGTGRTVDLATVVPAEIDAAVEKLRADRDLLMRTGGEHLGRAKHALASFEAQLSEARQRAAQKVSVSDLGALRPGLASIEAEIEEVEGIVGGLVDERAQLEPIARGTWQPEKPSVCPAIPGHFECPATAVRLQRHADAIMASSQKARDRISAIDHALQEAEGRHASLRDRRRSISSDITKIEAAETARAEAEAQIPELVERVDHARQYVSDMEAAGGGGDQSAAIKAIDERITRGLAIGDAKRVFDRESKRRAESAAKRMEVEDEIARWDSVVKAYSPEGIESELVRRALGPVQDRLALTGGTLGRVSIGPDLEPAIEVDGCPRTIAQLSRSQRYRLAIAMQDAVAKLAGFPFLLVDELDLFVQETQGRVIEMLISIASGDYRHVIAFGSSRTAEPVRPKHDSVSMFHVRDGRVVEVR